MTVISEPNEYSVEGMVSTEGGNQRVLMTQNFEGTQQNYSETSVECIVEDSSGNKQRCVCVNNFGGGGSSGGVTSVNGQTGAVTLGADDVLPSQTGNSGKFLTTDGTNASWGSISAGGVTSVNGQTGDVSLTASDLGAIENKATGTNATNILGSQYGGSASNSTSVGVNSLAGGSDSTSFGCNAWVGNSRRKCVAVGASSSASGGDAGIAIGVSANSGGVGTICIGYGSFSLEAGTVNFGITTDGLSVTTYKLLNSDGTIPAERHATLPASDGTYTLKLTISGGTPTLAWVAD